MRARTCHLGLSMLVLVALTATGTLSAQSADTRTAAASVPPLIDRELLFGNPEITGAQISPDGQFISFIKPYRDTRNVWVKKTGDPFSAGKLVTADTRRPIPSYFWSWDSKYIQWGDKMQDDITWGVKHLIAGGIADPKRVGIMGGSYGGYATLAGVAFTPDLYAAGVSIVGPSNLITLLETIPPYWASGRAFFAHSMGDSSTPEGRKQLERQSPLNSAAKIKTPLLVVQGANDPRVKRAESDQIVIALRDRGFPVEYLVAPDEGHGFARPVNNMAMYAAAEKFLSKHLEGRFQEGMTPEVATRLKESTVDPKTVTLKK